MPILLDIAYAFILLFAFPFLFVKSKRTGKYRTDWPARFGRHSVPAPKPPGTRRLMIHCVSVGELLSVKTLADSLLAADPSLHLLITTTTDTGTLRARQIFPNPALPNHNPRILTARYPLDFSWAVKRFLTHFQPDAIALIELETWPNFLTLATCRKIPVFILNGRLTARAFSRYKLIRPVVASMLRKLTWLGIQTPTIADRFIALGTPPKRITILPTLKYDAAQLTDEIPGKSALASAMGITTDLQLFTAGSTAPGEEAPILQTYLTLQKEFPQLRLAIAPRKPESVAPLLDVIRARNLTPIQRTKKPDAMDTPSLETCNLKLEPSQILVLDTLGELKKLYALSTFVFVGRSLVPLGGSDMIEVAAMARPLCFGPHTANFAEAVELLLQNQAAVLVTDANSLTATLHAWLQNPAEAKRLATRAQQLIADQRGSTQRYVEKILSLIPQPPPH